MDEEKRFAGSPESEPESSAMTVIYSTKSREPSIKPS